MIRINLRPVPYMFSQADLKMPPMTWLDLALSNKVDDLRLTSYRVGIANQSAHCLLAAKMVCTKSN